MGGTIQTLEICCRKSSFVPKYDVEKPRRSHEARRKSGSGRRQFSCLPIFLCSDQSGLRRKDGTPTGAIYGFFNSFFDFIDRKRPDGIAMCFDMAAPLSGMKILLSIKRIAVKCRMIYRANGL